MPAPNSNLQRSIKRTFYSLTRRYGEPGTIYKRTSTDTDYDTGDVTNEFDSVHIRRIVQVPVEMQRQVMYTASMMQSLRPFAWQGGQGQNTAETMFMILQTDIPRWGDIGPEQWINRGGVNYQVSESVKTPGGWILTVKQVKGADNGQHHSIKQDIGIEDTGGNTVA